MHRNEDRQMTFLEHLEELRWTIVWIVIATLAGTAAVWYFSDSLLELLARDLSDVLTRVLGSGRQYDLHVFEVAEAFTTKLKISLLMGFLLALPFNIYKAWQFISPGLFVRERRVAAPLVVLSIALFYCGVFFAYPLMVKLSVAFLFRLKPPSVVTTVRMGSYVSFVTKFVITFGLVFQLPLVLSLLSWMGLVSTRTLKNGWRYAVVITLVGAAVLTPPDIVSQLLMTAPVIALYWIGYLLALAFERRRARRSRLDTPAPGD
jgi:sec-independent protein translocase protein TatC